MATVDFYIWKRPAKDGKYPISVRITINRKPSYIMTGQKLDNLEQWDEKKQRVKKSHPNAVRLNNFLLSELAKANDNALEMEAKGHTSAKDVKMGLKPIEDTLVYFQDYAKNYLEEQRLCGNYDLFKNETTLLKKFYDFIKGKKIEFKDITVDLIQRYVTYLRMSKKVSI